MHDSDREHEQSLLAAAALGSLDPTDLAAFEQVLASSPAARSEFEQLREVVALLPYAAPPVTPPDHVRTRLMERIAADQAAQAPPRQTRSSRRISTGWVTPLILVGLTLVITLLGSLTLSLQQQVIALNETNQQLLAAVNNLQAAVNASEERQSQMTAQLATYEQQLARLNDQVAQERLLVSFVSAPGVATRELLPTRADVTARGEMYMYPGETQAVVVFSGLPALEPDRVYRFWLSDGTQRIAAGSFQVDATGLATLMVTAPREVNAYTEVMLTVEPATGTAPGDVEVILTGTL
ncbi:MAG TPA: anti-sigma factor [Chloroflexus aurantiacus]|jgi:anti-sigma-K factor RskA|uniref:Regulator of SigK n=1 Tax=Chloroflexus aurantiacus (strain ATCC 29366 / DSM 635 / J-10-fl) TaxID=324602 RepID=A9WBX0_CHLAA|nr:anti-sigma factor [Chloroflexus aurantiacus]ABY36922.1 putative transmembrane anti-sigma factor [Chloroflexus aurantiacus J-10-fl]RMG50610.1 MAG: anti-sigma factor [Chloroflexota bacterium]HBW68389.1 anti-sigma factor [Chloroflexus aurantiacus]